MNAGIYARLFDTAEGETFDWIELVPRSRIYDKTYSKLYQEAIDPLIFGFELPEEDEDDFIPF